VAGGFVWSGWDYLGEPTPYYLSRSSYFGIIDLAGFKKDRFYLYQSRWRPDLPMAHILPHWSWPERVGKVTPVHVFTSGDEAELFVNNKSQGRKQKGEFEYRLRWDDVVYQPGELRVVACKNNQKWAEHHVNTAAAPSSLALSADRQQIATDGQDLSFITLRVTDAGGLTAPRANNLVKFALTGPAEIVATDNGDPSDLTPFSSNERAAFNGLCLVIVRSIRNRPGEIQVLAESGTLTPATLTLRSAARTPDLNHQGT
jgi:beta-galactosidase